MSKHTPKNVVLLPIADLKTTILVRKRLDDDRVLHFMELYEAGTDIPPIRVVRESLEVIDGRHRIAAKEMMNRREIEAELVNSMEAPEALIQAFAANFGGALPPTRADIIYVMKQLIESGMPNKHIIERFSQFYTPSMARKAVAKAQSELAETRLRKAVQAVAGGGMTVVDAAVEYKVDQERLGSEITGAKRKKPAGLHAVKSGITSQYRSNSMKTSALLKNVRDRFEDGEVDSKYVNSVLSHVKHMIDQANKSLNIWAKRFEVIRGTHKAKAPK